LLLSLVYGDDQGYYIVKALDADNREVQTAYFLRIHFEIVAEARGLPHQDRRVRVSLYLNGLRLLLDVEVLLIGLDLAVQVGVLDHAVLKFNLISVLQELVVLLAQLVLVRNQGLVQQEAELAGLGN